MLSAASPLRCVGIVRERRQQTQKDAEKLNK